MPQTEHSFKPMLFKDTHTLILGSFPSIKSFENDLYYGNPLNQFWKILKAVTLYPVNNNDQKIWLLKECKLGLWDMIATCKRESSLDSSLENETVNDIPALLEENPNIKKIAFTGKKSEALFNTHFSHLEIETVYLPSPSPAYAAMKFEDKVLAYKKALGY